MSQLDRRDFLKSAGAGITAAGVMLSPREQALAQADAEKNRLARIAACSYPIR
jgi:anaerobic selenocysteine-containing dehydrogenase